MRFDRSLRLFPALFLAMFALFANACAVTEADIEAWKGTVRGPGKIVAVLLADKYSDELRIHAAVALVEMERADVDGVTELQGTLRDIPEETRRRIVDGLAPHLLRLMAGDGTPVPEGAAPPALQVRAKDASFLVLQYASAEHQAELTNAVVGWFVQDFNGRSLAGNFSAEQVIRQLGAPAATRLVDAMNEHLPQQALTKIAELVSQLGDAATKERAGARIVEVEQAMESPAFTQWLTERIRRQASEAGRQVADAQVTAAVDLNRETFILQGALPAMHHLADSPAVAARLLTIAQATTNSEERRVTALQALEGHTRPEQGPALLALALAPTQPGRVRDYAFDRIADSRDRSVLPQLWPLAVQHAGTEAQWRERWRVGSLLLSLGGSTVVDEWFSRIPAESEEPYAREELHGYAERLAQMRPEPTATLRARLASPRWFDQAIALYYLERQGTEADLPAISALTSSTTATRGAHWAEHDTLGKIATDVVAAVRERIGQAAPAAGAAPAH